MRCGCVKGGSEQERMKERSWERVQRRVKEEECEEGRDGDDISVEEEHKKS